MPYNAELLLLWNGHCNSQFVKDDGLAAYISKYVTKGEPTSLLQISDTSAIVKHQIARRIGSMESMVLALGLDIFRSSSGCVWVPVAVPNMRNSTVRPARQLEENPEDAYYPDGFEKYFTRPREYENSTYFEYFTLCEIKKTRLRSRTQVPIQDGLGYWVYSRMKPLILQTPYKRLCDGEGFFFVQLLQSRSWRSDDEILGGAVSYQETFSTKPRSLRTGTPWP